MEDLNAWLDINKYQKDKGLNQLYNTVEDMIDDVNNGYPHIWDRWMKEFKKSKRPKKASYLYLTLSPDKFLRNIEPTQSNIDNLHKWAHRWFECDKKYYKNFAWVIESGSKNDHLHLHAVMEMTGRDHHSRALKDFWKIFFPNNQLLTSVDLSIRYKCPQCIDKCCKNPKHRGEYAYLQFNTEEILKDKLEYFENEMKGTHANEKDLGCRGCRGFLTDI
jgi:hypothetical protein